MKAKIVKGRRNGIRNRSKVVSSGEEEGHTERAELESRMG